MPRYKITDPNTGKTFKITGDSPPSEQELNDIFSSSGIGKTQPEQAPEAPSAMGTAMGMVMPQIENSPAGLLNQGMQYLQKGTSLLGDQVKQKLPQYGIKPLFGRESVPVSQGVANAIGTAVKYSPDIASAVATPIEAPVKAPKILKGAGNMVAGGIQKLTGIPEEATTSLFKKPMSLFSAPTQKQVSKAYAASEFGDVAANLENSLDNIIQKAKSTPRGLVSRGANALKQYVEEGTANAKAILEGRKGLDREIDSLQSQINTAGSKNASASALNTMMQEKLNLRKTLNRALDVLAPKLREADALASERFNIAPFRELFLPGEASFISPKGVSRMVPFLPQAVGVGVSGAGAVSKVVEEGIKKSPSLITPAANRILKKRQLDKKTAAKYLDMADGDVDKALELANKDGY